MKYFKTKHEKDSAKITALIAIIVLLLLFVVGPPYQDPPEEYGVAVNFGTTNFGKGNVQPKAPVKSEPNEVNKPPQPDVSQPQPTKTSEVKEEVITEENAESIAIKKQKAAEAKAKAIAEAKAKAEAERIAKEKREQEEKKKKLDALIGGVSKSKGTETGSEGNDDKAGDKGQLDGNPYAPSYFGGSGPGKGGVGYGLGGRGRPTKSIYKQDCNEFGLVVVKIIVNRNGNVIEAVPGVKGTTNTAKCLLDPAKKIALSHKWPADSKAPAKQIGFVSINFDVGN
ncbi:energy transducer TonB [Seonamhaeicola algicola]|uniref:Energy transducer TonB n=1 Tax=Seonamhaeicola algicola TaxID=1719036 RepID=A0A5C7AHX2_9FLAO|nr:energy transducer TonB [Seonamhaeicola algicola]TXE06175.1 energy transducer TonB [Seonamhaeicola algicola]